MRTRRFRQAGISFFAFQDIITAVAGIMLLVALLMSLDIVKRGPSLVKADPELIRQRDALRRIWTDLQPRLGAHSAGTTVADADAENLSRQNRAALIAALTAEAERLRGVFPDGPAGETKSQAAERKKIEEARAELKEIWSEISGLEGKNKELEGKVRAAESSLIALKRDKDMIWVFPGDSQTAKEPLIVSVLTDSFVLEELDSREKKRVPRTSSIQSDIANLLQGFGAINHYAVLYFRPSTLPDFEAVKIAVSEGEGFEVGYDVVEDGKTVSFASKAGAGEAEPSAASQSPPGKTAGAAVSAEDLEARGEPMSSGSGFYISSDGFFVTNHHVVAGAKSFFVGSVDHGWKRAELVAVDKNHDLALLKTGAAAMPVSVVHSDGVRLGQTAATVGFPNIQLQGISPKLSKGEISSLAGLQDDPNSFQISLPVQPGNSGGALFDESGNVVGVVNARINQAAAFASTGTHAENVNYAIKSGVLLSWLDGLKIPQLEVNTAGVSTESFEEAVENVQKSAALILSYPE